MRSERWNELREIKKVLADVDRADAGAGPVLSVQDGRKLVYDGPGHCCFIGNTGKGKSESGAIPLLRTILEKGESAVVADPKGELYHHCACYVPGEYQTFCLDLSDPENSPTGWNFLSMIQRLFASSDSRDRTLACELLNEAGNGLYPAPVHSDLFWTHAASNYFQGLVYGLMEMGEEERVNLDSVIRMMEQSEGRFANSTYIQEFYDRLPEGSQARKHLAVYVGAGRDTRGSIYPVAVNGLAPFSRSPGLLRLLANDTLNIMDLDVSRPFVIFIILPDETSSYDAVAGMLVSQLLQYLIRSTRRMGGRLPIRCNVILEELSSVGKSIPNLNRLMASSRSRNIRLFLLLQSYAQLDDTFGKSKAESILDCVSITVGFSTNSWDTLNQWSQRCGERLRVQNGIQVREHLITPTQLAAMPTGTAMVLLDDRYKFISHFPRYRDAFDVSHWQPPALPPAPEVPPAPVFDLHEYVKEAKRREMEQSHHRRVQELQEENFELKPLPDLMGIDLDAMMRDIDAKIAELDAQETREREEKEKLLEENDQGLIYQVVILNCGEDRKKVERYVSRYKRVSLRQANRMLSSLPLTLDFTSPEAAQDAFETLKRAGASLTKAVITGEDLEQ